MYVTVVESFKGKHYPDLCLKILFMLWNKCVPSFLQKPFTLIIKPTRRTNASNLFLE